MTSEKCALLCGSLLALVLACRTDPTSPNGTPSGSHDARADAKAVDASMKVVIEATEGWTATVDGASCTHVPVRRACSAGMCRVPAGCFLQGSPEEEQTRGENAEPLAPITLTHSFDIGETEVTVEEWSRFSPTLPNNRPGSKPDSPAWRCVVRSPTRPGSTRSRTRIICRRRPLRRFRRVTSSPAARARSAAAELCGTVNLTAKTIYDCTGFRLPTYAEWEYAARAGSRTTVYSGNLLPVERAGERFYDPNLDAIAWYGWNSGETSHAVAQKLPNAWGLYDTIGNVFELVNDRYRSHFPTGPQTDQGAVLDGQLLTDPRSVRGCAFYSSNAYSCRSAAALSATPSGGGMPHGFRMARTR